MSVFQRTIGLETEYALRLPSSGAASHRDAYDGIVRNLRRMLPIAKASPQLSGKEGVFLATGGAVWYESPMPQAGIGMIEGSTPECRSPRDLLACQRAQDELLSQAARTHGVALLKNCRDAQGNAYSAHENYEVTFARGAALWLWRIGVWTCMLPLVLLLQTAVAFALFGWLVTLPLTTLVHFAVRPWLKPALRQRSFDFWIGRVWRKGWNGVEIPCSGWTGPPLFACVRLIAVPLVVATRLLVEFTALGKLQRQLAPFLATRIVFTGAGRLDPAGRFQLSDKADSIRCLASIPEVRRGFFSLGQLIKPCNLIIRINELWRPRQRLQIAAGDCNLCEEAEYLRIATTLLVIDALEAGALAGLPRLAQPVQALHAINADPTLTVQVVLRGGRRLTALEIQRLYLAGCRKYVASLKDAPEEVLDVLDRWELTLHKLVSDRRYLVGRIDWVTKQMLLERTAASAPYAVRKKIDLKYHELSERGYFRRLSRTGLHRRLLTDEEVRKRMRLPPPGTNAARRGRRVREFPGHQYSWAD